MIQKTKPRAAATASRPEDCTHSAENNAQPAALLLVEGAAITCHLKAGSLRRAAMKVQGDLA